ncbi:hypothetical protein [Chitinophaga sp. GbtcB8]|uniref:hypothetical protein n=1 Tax=Chitinophaga sp. GbtcB8 TaxID=2824753 RepID=UPI001C30B4E1|nr:hypothetical protein [Chitinophaga sp. GbtcB8]
MKRSKLFLGLSTVALAFVGIAATKATTMITPYYYQKGSLCVQVTQNANCKLADVTPCTYVTSGSTHRAIFQNRTVQSPTQSTCSNQLFVIPQ